MKKTLLFFSMAAIFISSQVFAQERSISGKVTSSEDGSALPGVNVILKGTTTGTVTDIDGNYKMNVPSSGGTLVFSFIGYVTQEVDVGSRSVIDIQMAPDVTELSEVVVVGYGTQLKTDLTGNIASVSGEEIENMPVPSFEQAIQGRTAGVNITSVNGKLGQTVQIRVRGSSSVSASNEPLYIVDGVPITSDVQSIGQSIGDNGGSALNPLADLNFNDIESIEILKDASAAAIYGSRASNGVVLITTKRGKEGKTSFNVNLQTGFSNPTNKVDWLNRDQYLELYDEAFVRSPFNSDGTINGLVFGLTRETLYDIFVPGWDDPAEYDTDWQELAFRTDAPFYQADISARGGTDNTSFFVSGHFNEQEGIIVANKFKRMATRINLDHQATDKLKFGLQFSLARTKNNRLVNDNFFQTPLQAIAQAPVQSPYDPSHPTGLNTNTLYYNFLITKENSDFESIVFRNLTNIYADLEIIPGLIVHSQFGLDLLTQNDEQFFGRFTLSGRGTDGLAFQAWFQNVNYNWQNYINFNKTLGDVHTIDAVLGTEYQQSRQDDATVESIRFPNDNFRQVSSGAEIQTGTGTETNFRFVSYFLRGNYKYSNKYLLTLSGRIDGSSRFGENERWGFFPAAAVGWIISEEPFLSGLSTLSFLKLRASWGRTGNAEIGNFPALALFSGAGAYAGFSGTAPVQVPNPDLKWETTDQFDIGIDFGLLDDRITGEVDYYFKDTEDLLLNVNVPGTTGFRTATRNVGKLENKGIEVVINSNNLVGELTWTSSFNIAFNDNEITDLQDQVIEGGFINQAREGEPIGVHFGIEYAGVDPNNGDALYYLNDGTEGTTTNPNEAEKVVIGNPNPDFIGGFSNNLTYKGIDVSFLFQFVDDVAIYNGGGRFQETAADFYDNQTVSQMDRWQNPGDITEIPEARLFGGNGTAASSRYIQDGSYLRLKNATVGYSLPQNILNKVNLTKVRVYFSGLNLLTFTEYGDDGRSGWDPEVNSDFVAGNIGLGTDFYSAPQPKTFTFGLNIGF